MKIILRDRSLLDRDRVQADVDCPDDRCGAQRAQPCIGRRGPRQSLHMRRWRAWATANSHLVLVELTSSRLSPRVEDALIRARNEAMSVDELFAMANTAVSNMVATRAGTVSSGAVDAAAVAANPGQEFAYLLDFAGGATNGSSP